MAHKTRPTTPCVEKQVLGHSHSATSPSFAPCAGILRRSVFAIIVDFLRHEFRRSTRGRTKNSHILG